MILSWWCGTSRLEFSKQIAVRFALNKGEKTMRTSSSSPSRHPVSTSIGQWSNPVREARIKQRKALRA